MRRKKYLKQKSLENIEKKLSKKNLKLEEVREFRKKLNEKEKAICDAIEKLDKVNCRSWRIKLEGVHTIATTGINRYNMIMKLTQEQYEKISKHLPKQRGNVRISNLQSPISQCDIVYSRKRVQVEGSSKTIRQLAYNICSYEQMEQKWSAR